MTKTRNAVAASCQSLVSEQTVFFSVSKERVTACSWHALVEQHLERKGTMQVDFCTRLVEEVERLGQRRGAREHHNPFRLPSHVHAHRHLLRLCALVSQLISHRFTTRSARRTSMIFNLLHTDVTHT